ncbi:MAG: phage tail protein [Bacteroidota bacterium]
MDPRPIFRQHFQIFVEGISDNQGAEEYFYSIDGLEQAVVFNTQDFLPGGTRSPLETPIAQKAGDLILKRPLMEEGSKITQWCTDALNKLYFKIRPVHIFLLNRKNDVVAQWNMWAYPINIRISTLGREPNQANDIVEEVITLRYEELQRSKPGASK